MAYSKYTYYTIINECHTKRYNTTIRKEYHNMTLYHVTTKENLESILKKGLIPNYKSKNSKFINDNRKGIFLCDKKSIPYWMIILKCDTILKITIETELINTSFSYTLYNELIYDEIIPADKIRKIKPPTKTILNFTRETLCDSIIRSLSNITHACATFYNKNGDYEYYKDYINGRTAGIKATGERIDIHKVSDKKLKQMLREFGDDGEFTFCDTYMNTPVRLWEQLIRYPKDDTYKNRKYIHDFIKSHFKNVLYTNTGGFTC